MKSKRKKIILVIILFSCILCNSLLPYDTSYGKENDNVVIDTSNETVPDNITKTKSLSKNELKQLRSGILYKLLSKKEKKLYERIYISIQNMNTNINLKGVKIKKKAISKIWNYLICEHPEIFWVNDSDYKVSKSAITIKYTMSDEEKKSREAKLEEVAYNDAFFSTHISLDPRWQVIVIKNHVSAGKYLNQDEALVSKTGCDDILIDGEGTGSAAFARAFQYLCQKAGYECLSISGKFYDENKGNPDHFYNVVLIDGIWYLVEPQEDTGEENDKISIGINGKIAVYKYFDLFDKYDPVKDLGISSVKPDRMLSDVYRVETKSDYPGYYYDSNGYSKSLSFENFKFDKLEDNTLLLLEYDGNEEVCSIPEKVEGMEVAYISSHAFANLGNWFKNNSVIKKIIIPKTIKGIYKQEDRKEGLYTPRSLEEFDVSKDNKYLKSVDGVLYSKDGTQLIAYPNGKDCGDVLEIPDGVMEIFHLGAGRGFKKVVIPGSVKQIYPDTCYHYSGCRIEELVFSDGVKFINDLAFRECRIDKIYIPKSMYYFHFNAFQFGEVNEVIVDKNNKELKTVNGSLLSKDGKYLLIAAEPKLGDTQLAESRNFIVPDGVKYVYDFPYYSNLYLSSSVTNFYYDLFRGSTPFSYTISEDNQCYCIWDDALYTKDMKTLVKYFGNENRKIYIIPDGVENIAFSAFDGKNMEKIVLPGSVKYLGDFCFRCKSPDIIVLGELEYVDCNFIYQHEKNTNISYIKKNNAALSSELKKQNNSDIKVNYISKIDEVGQDGNLPGCTVYDKKNKIIFSHTMNQEKNGRKKDVFRFSDGSKSVAEYDIEGHLLNYLEYDKDGKILFNKICEYNNYGSLIKETISFNDESTIYQYGKDGTRIPIYWSYAVDENTIAVEHYDGYGKTISEEHFNRNNELVYSLYYEYDKEGWLSRKEEKYSDGRSETYTYDKYNNTLSAVILYENGKSSSSYKEYNDDNQLVKEVINFIDGSWRKSEYEYNIGKKIKLVIIDSYGVSSEYYYDEYGNYSSIRKYRGSERIYRCDYEYDDNHNKISETEYNRDDRLQSQSFFDDQNRETKNVYYHLENGEKAIRTYDEHGNEVSIELYDSEGNLKSSSVTEYQYRNDIIVKSITRNSDGTYEVDSYDEYGNYLSYTTYDEFGNIIPNKY